MPSAMFGEKPNGTPGSAGVFAMTRPLLGRRVPPGSRGPSRPFRNCSRGPTGVMTLLLLSLA
eukprot:4242320-Alexandrium_andersonii.AAC.1